MSRRLLQALLLLALPVLIAAGCGGESGDADADPAAIVPARASVYVEGTLNPEGDQEDALKSLSEKLAGTNDPGGELIKLIEKESKEDGDPVDWEKDIEPWLGDRAGVFVTSVSAEGDTEAAVVAATKDVDKARDTLEGEIREPDSEGGAKPKITERTYKETEYQLNSADDEALAFVDDYAVFGTEQAIRGAIDAKDGQTLADSDAYEKAKDQVEADGLAVAYVKVSQLLGALGPQGAVFRQALGSTGDTFAVSLKGEKDLIQLDGANLGVKGDTGAAGPGKVFGELPGSAWLALGRPDIGGTVQQNLEQLGQLGGFGGFDLEQVLGQVRQQTGIDVEKTIAWMGDAGVFVTGDGPATLGGALVVQTKDADQTEQDIPRLARLVTSAAEGAQARPLREEGVDEGVTLRIPQVPLPIHMALADDKFIVAVGDVGLQEAVSPTEPLSRSGAYQNAAKRLGDGLQPQLFVDATKIGGLIDATGASSQEGVKEVRRALDSLTTIVAGSKKEGDTVKSRFQVGVK